MESSLEPCPFCGGNATVYPRNCNKDTPYNAAHRAFPVVRCRECGSEAAGEDWKGPETAVARWNRRATPAPVKGSSAASAEPGWPEVILMARTWFEGDPEAALAELEHRATATQPSASAEPIDTPLPCLISVDGASFGKGVPLRTFVEAATRWRREAFGPPPSEEEKAANLARLQGVIPHGPHIAFDNAPFRDGVCVACDGSGYVLDTDEVTWPCPQGCATCAKDLATATQGAPSATPLNIGDGAPTDGGLTS